MKKSKMGKKGKSKRAALSIKFIIILAILLLGFAVILFIFSQYNWKGEIDKKACHQSVIYKASAPEIKDKKILELPLNCKTEKFCITANWFFKGNCDDDFLGEEYKTKRISKNEENWDDEINQIIADELYDCWWMMGQGQVQIYSRDWSKNDEKRVCNICSRIAFDKELQEELKLVRGTTKYLTTHKIPDSDITYWQFLTNSNSNYIYDYSEDRDIVTTSQKALVFAELSHGALDDWLLRGGGIVGFGAAGAAIGSIVPVVGTAIGGGVGFIAGAILGYGVGDEASNQIDKLTGDAEILGGFYLVDYNFDELDSLECSSFKGKA